MEFYKSINKLYFLIIILLAILIRYLFVFISDFNQNVLFVGMDAWGMHLAGIDVSNWKNIKFFDQTKIPYISFLAYTYKLLYPSYLIGASLSLFFWLLSLIYFVKIQNLLKINNKYILFGLILYCFLPTMIIYTSTTIREPYQLFLTNLMIFYVLIINQTNEIFDILRYLLILVIFTFFYYLTHRIGPLFGFINIMIAIILIVLKINFKKIYLFSYLLFMFFLVFIFLVFIDYFTKNYSFEQFQKGYIKAIEIYQNGLYLSSPDSRGSYFSLHNFNSIIDILFFSLLSFIKYNFEPIFSLHKFILKDLILVFENVIRFLFYTIVICGFYFYKLFRNKEFIIIFSVFIINELIWSLGTNNWGTASRHHIPSIGLMLISTVLIFKNPNEKK